MIETLIQFIIDNFFMILLIIIMAFTNRRAACVFTFARCMCNDIYWMQILLYIAALAFTILSEVDVRINRIDERRLSEHWTHNNNDHN